MTQQHNLIKEKEKLINEKKTTIVYNIDLQYYILNKKNKVFKLFYEISFVRF